MLLWHLLCLNLPYSLGASDGAPLPLVRAFQALCLGTQPRLTLCNPMDRSPPGSSVRGDSPGKKTGVGCQECITTFYQPKHQKDEK